MVFYFAEFQRKLDAKIYIINDVLIFPQMIKVSSLKMKKGIFPFFFFFNMATESFP